MSGSRLPVRRRSMGAVATAVLGATLVVAGCDIPTDVPEWETTWVVPGDSTSLGVASLIPDRLEPQPGGTTFLLRLVPFSFSETLGEMCGDCPDTALPAPKPAFSASFSAVDSFPDDVVAVAARGGGFVVTLRNGLSFDPLDPSGSAENGELRISVVADGTVLEVDTVRGGLEDFRPGNGISRALGFSESELSGGFTVEVALDSPEGDPVTMDRSDAIVVEVSEANVDVRSAEVVVDEKTVTTEKVSLNVEDVDETVIDHVLRGALRIALANPWDVAGIFELRIASPAGTVTKSFEVEPETGSVTVELTAEEFATFLGEPDVTLESEGIVSSVGGPVAVEPGQVLLVGADLELVIGPEE